MGRLVIWVCDRCGVRKEDECTPVMWASISSLITHVRGGFQESRERLWCADCWQAVNIAPPGSESSERKFAEGLHRGVRTDSAAGGLGAGSVEDGAKQALKEYLESQRNEKRKVEKLTPNHPETCEAQNLPAMMLKAATEMIAVIDRTIITYGVVPDWYSTHVRNLCQALNAARRDAIARIAGKAAVEQQMAASSIRDSGMDGTPV